MSQPTIYRFGRAVAGSGSVEVGQDVGSPPFKGSAEPAGLGQRGRDAGGDGVDQGLHLGLSGSAAGAAVGGNHVLVDTPGHLTGA